MAEWLKAHAWKACIRETVSWVRIPLPPPAPPARTFSADDGTGKIPRNGGILRVNLWTDNVGSPSPRSPFALFSPKLWTVLNQYGAGRPCVMGLYEWLPGHEFENLSLGRRVRCENFMRIARCLTPKRGIGRTEQSVPPHPAAQAKSISAVSGRTI